MRYVFVFWILCLSSLSSLSSLSRGESPSDAPDGVPADKRLHDLQTLNGYFPFKQVKDLDEWKTRQAEIKRRVLVSQGLWPLPAKSPLNSVVHGRVERDDYTVDRVIFESFPGHYVTGSLYRPKRKTGPFPGVLSPHGHWKEGRFYDAGETGVQSQIAVGAETLPNAGRYPLQARAVQLARMGCVVFHYDMTGYADAIQLGHRPETWDHLDTLENWGFMSVQADLRLQNMMGLQTWNSIRAVDFLLSRADIDVGRIGVTGASGGGTQAMILGAIDDRVAASMPCVMVSTAMQGGCTCENAPLLRIDQGNIDIAAATAPRPLGLTAADDWTVELETEGYPDLIRLYEMLGVPERLNAVFHTQFKHNYNQVNRAAMYAFFNKHFRLGQETIEERDFEPLTREESTAWTDAYPMPSGDQVGDSHEKRLLGYITDDSDRRMEHLVPKTRRASAEYRHVVAGAWETILGRRLDQVGKVVFDQSRTTAIGDHQLVSGTLRHVSPSEQIALSIVESSKNEPSRGNVIWVANDGQEVVSKDGEIGARIKSLLEAGYRVFAPVLLGQSDDQESQKMWYQQTGKEAWHRFSGYTFGFNHAQFAQRTHDLQSVIKYASEFGDVALIGLGATAGPLAIAACSQSRGGIKKCIVDLDRFRFAGVRRHNDPMFVPGAVKYLDVDGLLSLCSPTEVVAVNGPSKVARAVYAAEGHDANFVTPTVTPNSKSLLEWLRSD